MARNRITCDFSGMDELLKKIDNLGGSQKLKEAIDESLQKSHNYVQKNLDSDIAKHKRTGRTAASLKNSKPKWEGNEGYIDVGFDIEDGGLPSIFLMYGTPRHKPNHPGMKADRKLYNDVYGSSTKKKIQKIQKEAMEQFINKNF